MRDEMVEKTKFLTEIAVCWAYRLRASPYSPHIMTFLEGAKEWDKLRCWISVVWMVWPPEGGETMEEDLEQMMLLLIYQQPGALHDLEANMKQWNKRSPWDEIPKSFQQICKQACDKAAQQATW